MSQPVEIRLYRADDAQALLALYVSAVRSAAARDYDAAQIAAWSAERDLDVWTARREAKPTYVAERDGEVAGFCDLEPDGHIDVLYVHADHLRRGVATALLVHVEATARGLGLARLYTEASLTARPVFERQGFVVLAQQTVAFNGEAFVNFRMEKPLD